MVGQPGPLSLAFHEGGQLPGQLQFQGYGLGLGRRGDLSQAVVLGSERPEAQAKYGYDGQDQDRGREFYLSGGGHVFPRGFPG